MFLRLRTPETPWRSDAEDQAPCLYNVVVGLLSAGGLGVFLFFAASFPVILAVATSAAFISAPIIALLVYRAMVSREVAEALRPSSRLRCYSRFSIGVLGLFALFHIAVLTW